MALFINDGANLTPAAPNHIGISGDNVSFDLVLKSAVNVGQLYSNSPGLGYRYPTKTILVLSVIGGAQGDTTKQFYELQDIVGGDLVAYNNGLQSELNAAAILVASW